MYCGCNNMFLWMKTNHCTPPQHWGAVYLNEQLVRSTLIPNCRQIPWGYPALPAKGGGGWRVLGADGKNNIYTQRDFLSFCWHYFYFCFPFSLTLKGYHLIRAPLIVASGNKLDWVQELNYKPQYIYTETLGCYQFVLRYDNSVGHPLKSLRVQIASVPRTCRSTETI